MILFATEIVGELSKVMSSVSEIPESDEATKSGLVDGEPVPGATVVSGATVVVGVAGEPGATVVVGVAGEPGATVVVGVAGEPDATGVTVTVRALVESPFALTALM